MKMSAEFVGFVLSNQTGTEMTKKVLRQRARLAKYQLLFKRTVPFPFSESD